VAALTLLTLLTRCLAVVLLFQELLLLLCQVIQDGSRALFWFVFCLNFWISWSFFCATELSPVLRPSPSLPAASGRPVGVVFRGNHRLCPLMKSWRVMGEESDLIPVGQHKSGKRPEGQLTDFSPFHFPPFPTHHADAT
jgi:hypothetical protein